MTKNCLPSKLERLKPKDDARAAAEIAQPCRDEYVGGTSVVELVSDTTHVLVDDAITLVVNAVPYPDEAGLDGLTALERAVDGIDQKFLSACNELNIRPRNPHDPFSEYVAGDGQADLFEITVEEFMRYAAAHGVVVKIKNVQREHDRSVPASAAPLIPIQRSKAQDEAILSMLREMNLKPRELPKRESGKRGTKAKVWEVLRHNQKTFSSRKVFDIAWQRLRDRDDIVD